MSKLKNKRDQIPALPGVYKMLDASGRIIYVGKSKCLKKRVNSYFTKAFKHSKIEKMVFLIADIEYVVTDTHLEARLLECQLIKEIKPYFNAQMKNDRNYFYLKVSNTGRPPILSTVSERAADSFGPFRGKQVMQSLIDALTHLYPIVFHDSSYDFEYHALPLTMNSEAFRANQNSLRQLFSVDSCMQGFIQQVTQRMEQAAAQFNYERAAFYRDLIKKLTDISHLLHDYKRLATSELVLKIPVREGEKLFFISNGQIVLKKYFPTLTPAQIDTFIAEASGLTAAAPPGWDEKTAVDFLNILFSEIQSLPEAWILNLA